MTIILLTLLAGLAALLVGGELLVRGAVGLAERAGVTPLMVGLVVVGFGTSMPELVTSVEAALAGSPAIAWSNIVGSNIANTFLILGAAAVLAPIVMRQGAALRDTGIAFVASVVLVALTFAGASSVWIGAGLVALLAAYIVFCYREEKGSAPEILHNAPYDRSAALELADTGLHPAPAGWGRPILLTFAGLALLIGGGRFLVGAAIDLSRIAGLSETLIGLTVVAIGTSLPELVTSLVAARKGEAEVAFGNVIGSNIYNILGIGGITMMVAPGPVPQSLMPFDLGVMTIAAAIVLVLVWFTRSVGRIPGIFFVLSYVAVMAIVVAQG